MRRYVVVAPLSPLVVGERFSTRDWPLHVTVVPTFLSGASVPHLAAAVGRAAAGLSAVRVVRGPDALFGPRHTVPVSEVVIDEPLRFLHVALVEGLRGCGTEFETPEYAGAGYRAHVTHRKGRRVEPGDVAELIQVALVDMNPGQELGMRAVLEASPLRTA